MAQLLDIPLPEVTAESFKRAWTRFELVAKAKEWEAAKQLQTVLPTLLRGKLVEKNVDFDDETKGNIDKLKAALQLQEPSWLVNNSRRRASKILLPHSKPYLSSLTLERQLPQPSYYNDF